ncbi:MAG TPA: hypothetical protein VJ946_00665, partial [Bacteroidales bacterium]|nr:hypothetical protein [Bacteroidales bacterium]
MSQAFYNKVLGVPEKFKLVWSLDSKKSKWFKNIDDIVKFTRMQNKDVYFGIGMADKNYGPKRRATSDTVTAISCLYLDIDIYSENKNIHSKERLPKTMEEAMEIATRF